MNAKQVWGVIFIVGGVGLLLYGANMLLDIINYTNQLNSTSPIIKQMASLFKVDLTNAYIESGICLAVGAYLAYDGTNMLNKIQTVSDSEKMMQDIIDRHYKNIEK